MVLQGYPFQRDLLTRSNHISVHQKILKHKSLNKKKEKCMWAFQPVHPDLETF